MFSKDTYIRRRNRLRKDVGNGLIVLLGNEESSINFKDNWYHFRQDSSFLYFGAVALPSLTAIFDCDSGEDMILGDELTIDDIVWTGPQPSIASLAAQSGITKTAPSSQIETLLKNAISAGRHIHFIPPYREEHVTKLSAWTGKSIDEIRSGESIALIKAIISQRNIKTSEEIVELHKAVDLTSAMHLAAMQYAKPGMKEAEIAARVNQVALAGEGQLSFPVIMTKNGQVLHNHYHGNTIQEGDMILCDTGAEIPSGYAGDMTRTFPVSAQFSETQRELYQTVLNAHEVAISALKPGIRYKDVHLLACVELAKGLTEVGLMKGNPEEAVAAGAHTMFFQCGLGHMMGMDVHDMENLGEPLVGYSDTLKKSTEFGLKSLRLGKELEAGFVITVEPGIYIIPELIDQWKAENKYAEFLNYDKLESYKSFGGIRIEEDFVITENGADLLGKPVAKTVKDVEEIRKEALQS
ncbi:Xaa-Pro aminopeptidase [Reichenbachiella faecimaris]|uniref:Xaa-Pro aminopeptidase n=1 Tax=Reichenbachiella faecimaris TaxID=692418 RepID=A0A1W2GCQ0_REIFA|nr:aminopeptidase P family protein [Reichenbachiella faecimaris]SMD34440.1 Xaa-Pro aminopeptidase [Reichenbachiella faecimaris]